MWSLLSSAITSLAVAFVAIGINFALSTPTAWVGAAACFTTAALLSLVEIYRQMDRRNLSRKITAVASVFVVAALIGSYFWLSERANADPPSSAGNEGVQVGHDSNGQVCTTGASCMFNQAPSSPPSPQGSPGAAPTPQAGSDCPSSLLHVQGDRNEITMGTVHIRGGYGCIVNDQGNDNKTTISKFDGKE